MHTSKSTLSQSATDTLCCVQALNDEDVYLNVDCMHMYAYDEDLYKQLIAYPGEVIPLLDVEAREIAEDLRGQASPDDQLITVSSTHLIVMLSIAQKQGRRVASLRVAQAYLAVNMMPSNLCVHAGSPVQPQGAQSHQRPGPSRCKLPHLCEWHDHQVQHHHP